jgi:hypothetical protein
MRRSLGIALFAIAAAPLVLGADMAAAFVNPWLAALVWIAAFGVLGSLLALGAERKTTAFLVVGLALAPIAVMAREHTPVIAVAIVALASVLAADVRQGLTA